MHHVLLSWEQGHSVEKGMKHSRTAEHLRCHSFSSWKCIILLSPITGGKSTSSSQPQQLIHHCRADHFISQKIIFFLQANPFIKLISDSSSFTGQIISSSTNNFLHLFSKQLDFSFNPSNIFFTGTYLQSSA